MKTLALLGSLCLVMNFGGGCSKKAVPAQSTETASTETPSPAADAAPAASAGAADGGYDSKVALALQATSGAPLSEAQKEAAARAEKQLLDSVEKDPQAAEAYKNLQRLRNGR